MILGDPKGREDYQKAIGVYEELAREHPDWIWLRTGLIETLREYSDRLSKSGDAPAAGAFTRRALRIASDLVGNKAAASPCFHKPLLDPFHGLAWDLVVHPPVNPSDVALAIRLARQALEWESTEYPFWNRLYRAHRTLGIACCRAGDWAAAASAFESSMARNNGGDARDWFFLAMVRRRQGDTDQAWQWYERAVGWMERNPTGARDLELRLLRSEAEEVLGRPPDTTLSVPRDCEPPPPPSILDAFAGPQCVAHHDPARRAR
jgi:tetratricopeptide (TPR) repeat protein